MQDKKRKIKTYQIKERRMEKTADIVDEYWLRQEFEKLMTAYYPKNLLFNEWEHILMQNMIQIN